MKKIFIILLTILFVLPVSVNGSTNVYERNNETLSVPSDIKITSSNRNDIIKTPLVNESEKIYDFANLIDDAKEEELYTKITKFINDNNMDMVIVTINTNNKYSAMKYSDDFFDYNNFGKNQSRDGILLLIDMDESISSRDYQREVYISTSGTGQLYLDDDRIESILDDIFIGIYDKDYYKASLAFVESSDYYIKKGIPSSNENSYIDENGNFIFVRKRKVNYIASLVAALIVSTITIFVLKSKHKGIRLATDADYYLDPKKTKVITSNDKYVTSTFTKTPIPQSSGSSGGHGGSSTHTGGSGRSHGGGGRRF